jgi:MOSC domain-containing protein YiiM
VNTGRLIGIARRPARRAPLQEIAEGLVSITAGLEGDTKGAKYPRRQITVLACEDWEAALAELGSDLPWTARRANLLIEGVDLPRAVGSVLRVGAARLEVSGQTYPCVRMEEVCPGLLKALAKDWRGGVTCRVLAGGLIRTGDPVQVPVRRPPEPVPRLPG